MTLLFFSSNSSVLLIPSEILAQWKSLKCVLFKGSTDALYLKVSSHFISFDPDCHPVGQGGQVLFPLWGEKNPESWEGAKAPTPTTVFFTRPPDASTETAVPDCPHSASLPVLHSVPGLESKCTRLNYSTWLAEVPISILELNIPPVFPTPFPQSTRWPSRPCLAILPACDKSATLKAQRSLYWTVTALGDVEAAGRGASLRAWQNH